MCKGKGKGLPQQAEVAQGFLGRLRPQIFLTFGTTRVAGRQPYAPAAFTSGEIPGTHFQRLRVPSSGATEKIPSDTTRNRSRDRPTSSATTGPLHYVLSSRLQYIFLFLVSPKVSLSIIHGCNMNNILNMEIFGYVIYENLVWNK
jgi:hypothetical protein